MTRYYTDEQLALILEARMKGLAVPVFCPTCGRDCEELSQEHEYGMGTVTEFMGWGCWQHCGHVAECSVCGRYRCEINDHQKSKEVLRDLCRCTTTLEEHDHQPTRPL
jgi:hypothetical protein